MKTLLAILFLLLPVVAWGADGDPLAGADTTKGTYESQSFLLCDTVLAADDACDEFDLNATGRGMPDYILFSRDTITGCSANPTIAINGQTTTGGTEHVITTLNNTYTSVRVETPYHRFIDADVTDDAGCTDLDVSMTLYFRKR